MNYYLGIDPGKSGGWAAIQTGSVPQFIKADCSLADIKAFLQTYRSVFAMLEYVSSSPQQGVRSAFTFGQSYGQIEGLLCCYNIPFDRVTPQKWQSVMGCRSGGDKNVTKRRAQELFPAVKVTHAIADALLIAEYCKRVKS